MTTATRPLDLSFDLAVHLTPLKSVAWGFGGARSAARLIDESLHNLVAVAALERQDLGRCREPQVGECSLKLY